MTKVSPAALSLERGQRLAPPGAAAGLRHVLRGLAHRLGVFAQVMQVLLHPEQVRVRQFRSRRRAVRRARAGR